MIVICWETVPGKVLADIKLKVEKFFFTEPFPSQIKAVNTIISRDRSKRTLQEMIEELSEGNVLREFKFEELNAVLSENGIDSHFG